jgi:CRP-like cAMP-binding protein
MYMFHEGEQANEFYLVRQGLVALEIIMQDGEAIELDTAGPGEILGWSWLLPPYFWHFNARALQDLRVFVLDGRCLRKKCEENHTLGYEMLKRFAQIMEKRLNATRLQVLDLYSKS